MAEDNDSYFLRVMLTDGRNLDIMTRQGADTLLSSDMSFIGDKLVDMEQARARLNQNNVPLVQRHQIQEMIHHVCVMLGVLANKASPSVFGRISTSQVNSLLSHASSVLSTLSTSQTWIATGVLEKHDQMLLDCLIPNMQQAVVCARVRESNLLQALAAVCAAREASLPCPEVTDSILCIVHSFCFTSLALQQCKKEATFQQLESSGILAQVIRCSTQPSPRAEELQFHLYILDQLMECPRLVKKTFQAREPSGKILLDVIAGRDGYKGRRNDAVMARLRDLERLVVMSNPSFANRNEPTRHKVCRACGREDSAQEYQRNLLLCSRCKQAYYCSKECQTQDWKQHKKICTKADKALKGVRQNNENIVSSFVDTNYYSIMKELVRVTQEHGVDKQEVILELDFFADTMVGCAPALRDPPEFKIGITSRYLEGERPDEPDWFLKGTEVYTDNIKMFLAFIKDQYSRMSNDRLLTIARNPTGDPSIYRLMRKTAENGTALFSDEAFDAFSRAMQNDDSRLEEVYGNFHRSFKARLDWECSMNERAGGGSSFPPAHVE